MKSRMANAFFRITQDVVNRLQNPGAIPVVYFTGRPNVGDLLNEYLIPRVSGKEIIKVNSAITPHLRAIGSVIGSSSQHSYIWGSGSIDGKRPSRTLDRRKIFALRGEKTRELIGSTFNMDLVDIPLGDPAILMPDFYYPDIVADTQVGIIPHFSDSAKIQELVGNAEFAGIKIISVEQEPENFVSEMLSCSYILSTSLHGLILADAYGIPNRWIKVSDDLLGGLYKFQDYYTTMDSGIEEPVLIAEACDLVPLIEKPHQHCRASAYLYDKRALLDSFPQKYNSR